MSRTISCAWARPSNTLTTSGRERAPVLTGRSVLSNCPRESFMTVFATSRIPGSDL